MSGMFEMFDMENGMSKPFFDIFLTQKRLYIFKFGSYLLTIKTNITLGFIFDETNEKNRIKGNYNLEVFHAFHFSLRKTVHLRI